MMQYFLDTSAIVKIYHQEECSEMVLPLYLNGKSLLISEISKVEFLSTIHKKFRNKEIDLRTVGALRDRFIVDTSGKFTVIPTISAIIDTALDLIEEHGKSHHIFSLDAMQVAVFSLISDNNTTFVCADRRLVSFIRHLNYPVLELSKA